MEKRVACATSAMRRRLARTHALAQARAGAAKPLVLVLLCFALAFLIVAAAAAIVRSRVVSRGFAPDPSAAHEGQSMLTDLIPDEEAQPPLTGGSGRLVNGGRAAADDDGELHVGWNDAVSWSFEEQSYRKEEVVDSKELGLPVMMDARISYPQLKGAGEHADAINAALRDAAMETLDSYLLKPDKEGVALMRSLVSSSGSESTPAVLTTDVTWAITYNSEDFVSVSFSDSCCIATPENRFILLRCVNANLKTGEIYALDDVLTLNEDIAESFFATMLKHDGTDANGDGVVSDEEQASFPVESEEFVQGLLGKGAYARRMEPTFFVDEKGRFNLAVNYWISSDWGWMRGWWDATLTDQQVEGARKESSLWGLIGK